MLRSIRDIMVGDETYRAGDVVPASSKYARQLIQLGFVSGAVGEDRRPKPAKPSKPTKARTNTTNPE